MRKRVKIKKCNCGEKPQLIVNLTGQWYVACPRCRKSVFDLSPKKAVELWNDNVKKDNKQ